MFASDRLLAVDVGASRVVVGEFQASRGQAPVLLQYDTRPLPTDPSAEYHAAEMLGATIRDVMRERGIRPAPLYLAISGQTVFPRYVKLPPVDRDKLLQIISYEAEQNVPFPIKEVVWDYQLLSEVSDAGASVMLMAVKTDTVIRLTDAMQEARLEPEVVDAGPMALYNAFVHTYGQPEGCTMILDIGAKATGLLFIEPGRVFSRSVPIAGNTITQEIARTFELTAAEAERLKCEAGQVGLGGVSELGQDETTEQLAKVIRNVVTRLHAEINRSINFYRSQQGGSAPARVLLTGGTSVLPHLATFFADKLDVPVDDFNPVANLVVGDAVSEDRITSDLQVLPGIVGLALRQSGFCAVEINLMPPAILDAKTFRRRQPYFVIAAALVIIALLGFWSYTQHDRKVKADLLRQLSGRIRALDTEKQHLDRARALRRAAEEETGELVALVNSRTRWIAILESLHAALLDGMWLTHLKPEIDRTGVITRLEVEGRGFEDKLKTFDTPPDSTAIEVFRDRLRESPLFKEEGTDISRNPPTQADYVRQFAMVIELAEPIRVR